MDRLARAAIILVTAVAGTAAVVTEADGWADYVVMGVILMTTLGYPTKDVDATLREAEELAQQRGLRWASEATQGDPAEVIVALAEKHAADVIVVGNKGMERRVLGSVPNTLTHKATCWALAVKTS